MTDSTEVTEAIVTPAPKASRPKRVKADTIAYSAVITKLADKNGTDTTRAGKALRARIRAMGDESVAKQWPAFKASQKILRDGNRYPSHMPVAFADVLLTKVKVK
jgi:hypothetical protein